jgi:alpha-tubulin suppressor-like RCC1 family protein
MVVTSRNRAPTAWVLGVSLLCLTLAGCSKATFGSAEKPARAIGIGAGTDFTCALTADGNVWCWGRNDVGQLGRDTHDTLAHASPERVALPVRVRTLSVGHDHACATAADGTAYCWGDDRAFESGAASEAAMCADSSLDTPCRPRPVKVSAPVPFRFVAAGYRESCGITRDDGRLFCWGDALMAPDPRDSAFVDVCGDSSAPFACRRHPRLVPVRTSETQVQPPVLAYFDSLAIGGFRSCGIMNPGRLYCWGRGAWSRLSEQGTAFGNVVHDASIGLEHACAVRLDGTVACMGPRALGALALGAATGPLRNSPRGIRVERWNVDDVPSIRDALAIDGGRFYVAVATGALHTCAIERDTLRAWCWGANQYGQLGVGKVDSVRGLAVRGSNPSPVPVLTASRFTAIASGVEHVCGVTADGGVLCWGRNIRGAAGSSGSDVILTPQPVADFR